MAPALFANFFQIAYVTTDMDRALQIFRDRYGVRKFFTSHADQQLTCPGGLRRAVFDAAMAWVGDTQIEVIQPTGGDCTLYSEPLPAGRFALQPHHYGYMVEGGTPADWQRFRAGLGAEHPIAAEASMEAGSWAYVDERATLGHYNEYMCLGSDGRAFMAQVPRN
jgi:hypothetical protein